MRALRLDAGELRLTEVPIPAVDGWVLVKVRGVGVCSTDVATVQRGGSAERTLGHEIAGELGDGTAGSRRTDGPLRRAAPSACAAATTAAPATPHARTRWVVSGLHLRRRLRRIRLRPAAQHRAAAPRASGRPTRAWSNRSRSRCTDCASRAWSRANASPSSAPARSGSPPWRARGRWDATSGWWPAIRISGQQPNGSAHARRAASTTSWWMRPAAETPWPPPSATPMRGRRCCFWRCTTAICRSAA